MEACRLGSFKRLISREPQATVLVANNIFESSDRRNLALSYDKTKALYVSMTYHMAKEVGGRGPQACRTHLKNIEQKSQILSCCSPSDSQGFGLRV
jgi:hypothetical protein